MSLTSIHFGSFKAVAVGDCTVIVCMCVFVHLWECVQYVSPCVWAAASSSFLLEFQSVEVMKINERNGGGRLGSRCCLPVSGQSSIDPPFAPVCQHLIKDFCTHTHTYTHSQTECTHWHKDSLMCTTKDTHQVALSLMLGKELSLHHPFYSFLHCLKLLKENVELTFHHCQIMLAEYSYFSHSKLPCGVAAFKYTFVSSYFRTETMDVQVYIMHSSAVFVGNNERERILQ